MGEFGPLVSGEWLSAHLGEDGLQVVDTRYYLDGRSNEEGFEHGHIPGAIYADIERDLTGSSGPGRHPLPTAREFESRMRQLGINATDRVVVYDDTFPSPRLRWLFRYFGRKDVAVLDGGLQAWTGPLEEGASLPKPEGDFTALPPRTDWTRTYDQVRQLRSDVLLLDARSPDRYRGEVAHQDPRAGHIPGARSAPWHEVNIGASGRFRSVPELQALYGDLGAGDAREIVAYCGSGVQACHLLLGLELAGFVDAKLYVGSWSDWSRRSDAPVATGPEP